MQITNNNSIIQHVPVKKKVTLECSSESMSIKAIDVNSFCKPDKLFTM